MAVAKPRTTVQSKNKTFQTYVFVKKHRIMNQVSISDGDGENHRMKI